MGLKTALRLASILALSATRTQRKLDEGKGFAKKPVLNLYFAAALFSIVALLLYSFSHNVGLLLARLVYSQASVFIPSFFTFFAMMYSLMYEFGQSSSAASTDMINWLPIRAEDYVLASTLSTLYYVSPMFGAIMGASLGAAVYAGALDLFSLSTALGLMSAFLGAFVLEAVRALMNRTSGVLGGRGRAALYIRMVLSLLLMASFYLIYNTEIMFRIVGWFSGNVNRAWFVPLLWPSLVVVSFMRADTLGVVGYSVLSLAITSLAFVVSTRLRTRYWAPAPVSYRMGSSGVSITGSGGLGLLGFSAPVAALIRKDLRSLVRRREMWRVIIMPFLFVMYMFINADYRFLWDPTLSPLERTARLAGFGIVAVLFALYMALSSIGQEGGSFDNLRGPPLTAGQITKAKVVASFIPAASLFSLLLLVLLAVIRPPWEMAVTFTVVGVLLVLEAALCGMVGGAWYPSFREVPQALYYTPWGSIVSMFILVVAALGTVAPVSLSVAGSLLGLGLTWATVISAVIAAFVCLILYRTAVRLVDGILEERMM
jgi:hypothetical protein